MSVNEVLDISREAILVLLRIGAPVMLLALLVGLAISLFQALTQIQEMTLAFVPKILVIFVAMLVLMPFMIQTLIGFTERLADRIISLGLPPV
ncbi:MAG: flagellar biosynthesis protein FliQ [Pseudomonadota bacterium]